MTDDIEFQFKGARTYVHGTDVFNALLQTPPVQNMGPLETVDLTFRGLITSSLKIVADDDFSDADLVRFLARSHSSEELTLRCTAGDMPVRGRYEYDEADVIKEAVTTPGSNQASLPLSDRYSFIEQLVALNKMLVGQCVSVPADRKWLFARLLFTMPTPTAGTISLHCDERSSARLTESTIAVDDTPRGTICFTAVKS